LARRLGTALLVVLVAVGCTQDPAVKKQLYLERGTKHYQEGKYNEAIIELKNALQIDPGFIPARHALGRAYKAKAWNADAVRELQRVVEAQPEYLPARIDLGQVSLELEAWSDAEAQGAAVREKEPDNARGLYRVRAALTGK